MYTIVDGYAYCIKGNIGYKISIDALGNTNLSSEDTINITNQPIYTYDEMNRKLNLKKQVDELRKELLNENTDLSIFSEFYDNVRKGFKDKKSFEKVVIKTVDKILNPPAPVHTHTLGGASIPVPCDPPNKDICYYNVKTCSECGEQVTISSVPHHFVTENVFGEEIKVCDYCHTPAEDLGIQDEATSHEHALSDETDIRYKHEKNLCYEDIKTCSECGDVVVVGTHDHNFVKQWEIDEYVWKCSKCGDNAERYGLDLGE